LIAVTLRPAVFKSRPVEEAGNNNKQPGTASETLCRTDNTLPDPTNNTSRNKDIFCHHCNNREGGKQMKELAKDYERSCRNFGDVTVNK
jgi:hypothetical protein